MTCRDCPRRARPGITYCARCRDQHAARQREYRAVHAALGQCTFCTRSRYGSLHYCLYHREAAARRKRTAAWRAANHAAKKRAAIRRAMGEGQ